MKLEGFFDGELSPRIEITVRDTKFYLVIDTGFNGELMLPQQLIDKLGFRYSMKSEAELADGSIVETTLYSGKITWFDEERLIQAISTNSEDGLMGTAMLFGVTLFMDMDENYVKIEMK